MFEYSRLKRRKYIKLSCTDHRIIFFRWRRGKQSRWNPNRKRSPKTRHLGKLRSLVRRPRRVERLVASRRTFEDMILTFFFISFISIFLREGSLDRGTRVDRVTRCIHSALLGHVSMGAYVVVVRVPRNAHTHTGTENMPRHLLYRPRASTGILMLSVLDCSTSGSSRTDSFRSRRCDEQALREEKLLSRKWGSKSLPIYIYIYLLIFPSYRV